MKNLHDSGYVLHFWWGWIKNEIKLKYLMLPITYLIVIFLAVPNETATVEVNKLTIAKLDTYATIEMTKDDKLDFILEKYNLSRDEFKVLKAIVLTEAEYNSYDDAYAVINTIYNRTHSKNWVSSVSKKFGKDKGKNLYYQAIHPNQFVVYQSGSYKKYLDDTSSAGYDAIIDFLYSEEIMHNYLSFRANSIKKANSESFSKRGNNYFSVLKEENRI